MENKLTNNIACNNCPHRNLMFEHLGDDDLTRINSCKAPEFFPKGMIICEEGDEINEFLYLQTGLVKLFKKGADKRDQIISIAKPFDYVGLLSVFSETKRKYSISAIEDSSVCFIELDCVKDAAARDGKFALSILQKMSQSSDEVLQSRFELSRKHLRGRIAYLLLFFANDIYESKKFTLPISRREIAELIDMTTENVIRILSEFRKDGIIGIDGKSIDILNEPMLETINRAG